MSNKVYDASRRRFIKRAAIGILGVGAMLTTGKAAVSPPDMGLPDPYPELPDRKAVTPPYNHKSLFFSEHQYDLIATLAALIIPTDDTAGATEAGVANYIDSLVAESQNRQAIYAKGLKWLDDLSMERSDKDFLGLDLNEQIDLLRVLDETSSMRDRPVSGSLQRVNRKIDKIWDDVFGVGENSRVFKIIRQDVIEGYYTSPISWEGLGYFGPPQPVGYPDFSDPPSSANYTGSVRLVNNVSCKKCHEEGRHPRGGLIDLTCTTCHRPHSPWPYDRKAFRLEDHIGFVFPNPDRKKGTRFE